MAGGTGDDDYVVDNVLDSVVEAAGEGFDTINSAIDYTVVASNTERLMLIDGSAAVSGTGDAQNNVIVGNQNNNILSGGDGNDFLDGRAGADTMAGGTGNDDYVVDNALDSVVEAAGEGSERVFSSVDYALTGNVELLVLLAGSAAVIGTGNALDNEIVGNQNNNILNGLDGNDELHGGGGDDTIVGGAGADTMLGDAGDDTYGVDQAGDVVMEQANAGIDTVQSSVDYTLGANVENLTLTGFAVNGTGNELNNTLMGNSAANVLTGDAGHDILSGRLGNDTYQVDRGEGQDTIVENDGTVGNSDLLLYGATINPLDLVLSQQANHLRIAIHGSTDRVTIQNWFSQPGTAQVETIEAGNGQTLLSSQVDQLIQAMASFSQQSGLTWDQAIDQQPQQVQAVLAASWQ
jgi:Ca2+-binding RTX toxin-like protein